VTIFGTAVTIAPTALKTEKLQTTDSPQQLFKKVQDEFEDAFLLESAKGELRLAEYSFIGFDPAKLIRVKGNLLEVVDKTNGGRERMKVSDPLTQIRSIMGANRTPAPYRFIGGAVGYISYDSVRYWERLPAIAKDDLNVPDMEFGIFTDGIVYDHASGEVRYHCLGEDRSALVRKLIRARSEVGTLEGSEAKPSIEQSHFERMVETAKDHITAGDIFQVVLSKRYDFELTGDLTRFYAALSRVDPSPYMYFLKFGQRRVIGSSPEMLVRVEDRRVETFPIAGTAPHVHDKKENARLTRELLGDPKERAEHVMLVDLARNDVGKVAKYGSVKVPELLTVQQFSHVQHIVSRVVGDLRDEFDSYDAMRAIFPAGTLSGAPKPRAMEIIEELEPTRRGAYGGAVGYFSFNGNADFAITIRTMVTDGKRSTIQTGAGIVADSSPEKEWHETEAKAAGLFKAVEAATGDKR
jgi:anthranilate synthase component I